MRRLAIIALVGAACGTGGVHSPEPAVEIQLAETDQSDQTPSQNEAPTARPDDGSWSGVLSCGYRISHGWGNIYECTIVELLDGTPPAGTVGLHLTVSDTQLLSPDVRQVDEFVARFYPSDRPYGPPSGYRDASGVYWVLVTDGQTP